MVSSEIICQQGVANFEQDQDRVPVIDGVPRAKSRRPRGSLVGLLPQPVIALGRSRKPPGGRGVELSKLSTKDVKPRTTRPLGESVPRRRRIPGVQFESTDISVESAARELITAPADVHEEQEDSLLPSVVPLYLAQVAGCYHVLGKDGEKRYYQEYKEGGEGAQKAKEILLASAYPLIISLAIKVMSSGGRMPASMELPDLIQIGNEAACHALDNYKPERQVRFITVAGTYASNAIRKALGIGQNILSVSHYGRVIETTYAKLYADLGREPTIEELVLDLHKKRKKGSSSSSCSFRSRPAGESLWQATLRNMATYMEGRRAPRLLTEPAHYGFDSDPLSEAIPDMSAVDPHGVVGEGFADVVRDHLKPGKNLTPKEFWVLYLRAEGVGLVQIGETFVRFDGRSVTRAAIRNLLISAIAKLEIPPETMIRVSQEGRKQMRERAPQGTKNNL